MVEEKLWKRAWEEVWFYHQFKRVPTPGWLKDGEYISSIQSITVVEEDTETVVSGMVLDQRVTDLTKVAYKIGGGVAGTLYEVRIRIVTSGGEKFEDHVDLEVVST